MGMMICIPEMPVMERTVRRRMGAIIARVLLMILPS
jgi:hypothetical protein